jgi:hypothetical protein
MGGSAANMAVILMPRIWKNVPSTNTAAAHKGLPDHEPVIKKESFEFKQLGNVLTKEPLGFCRNVTRT